MLSFREVHLNDDAEAAPSPYADPGFFRPPAISAGNGSGTPDPSTDGQDASSNSQALFYLANCPSTLQVGQAVHVTGSNSVDAADNQSPEQVIGIATAKRSDTTVIVQTAGVVSSGLSGLSPGVDYFLGSDGMLIAPPLSGVLYVQRVGLATESTKLYLQLSGNVTRQNVS